VRDLAPPLLVSDPTVASPLAFSSTRATDSALDHLVLSGDIRPDAVSREDPLQLRLHLPMDDDDVVLAVAREGDLFLPLGIGVKEGGGINVRLQRLPQVPAQEGSTRGPGQAVRIYFQRVIGRRVALDPGWPRLSLVTSPTVLDHDPARAAEAVASAHRILLAIHGILGDTRTMLPTLLLAAGDRYDCVLAYDYDTIGMTVKENADALRQRLADIGLTAEAAAHVDVVAHSIGALVARWWIERGDGNALVRHAVLTGAPNGGTPSAGLQGWATSALALGLNGLTTAGWPASVLGWLVAAMERADLGFEELEPGSDLLERLARSTAGGHYTVLLGDHSVPALALSAGDHGRLGRLLARLGTAAVAMPFLQQSNDLVATATSMRAFPAGFSPPPTFVDTACDHITYYENKRAIDAIAVALRSP
jgi:hypothetical protein